MATASSSAKSRKRARRPFSVHNPRGKLNPRVEAVGPKHFGIVAVDCAKHRSKWMLADFYCDVLIPPTELPHNLGALEAVVVCLRHATDRHHIKDLVVAIERTGNYHLPVLRCFRKHGFDCRIVHPFATKQFRMPADPGNKTDDTDLAAIVRATVTGFGLIELPLDPLYEQLRLLVRHRRDLVEKRAALQCQIREHLDAVLPGFALLFDDLWDHKLAMPIARHFDSAQALQRAGLSGLMHALHQAKVRPHRPCLERVLAWSRAAVDPHPQALIHHRIVQKLDDDRTAKTLEIQALEGQIAALLVQTPYVLLLSLPGLNVVSTADFAAEMGPIAHYLNGRAITGRAGLFPARFQSDQVDRPDGALIRCANRPLRASLMRIADNLVVSNHYFRARAELWQKNRKDPRCIRVQVACRFSRIAYQIVAGNQVCRHPGIRERSYILDKLLAFYGDHDIHMSQVQADLQAAVDQLPRDAYAEERAPLAKLLESTRTAQRRGAQALGDILPIVLAKLEANQLQSETSGDQDPS